MLKSWMIRFLLFSLCITVCFPETSQASHKQHRTTLMKMDLGTRSQALFGNYYGSAGVMIGLNIVLVPLLTIPVIVYMFHTKFPAISGLLLGGALTVLWVMDFGLLLFGILQHNQSPSDLIPWMVPVVLGMVLSIRAVIKAVGDKKRRMTYIPVQQERRTSTRERVRLLRVQ